MPRIGLRFAMTAALACLLVAGVASAAEGDDQTRATREGGDDRPVIGIEHEGPIRVVFQVTTPETKGAVNKGLFYLKKLHASYVSAGVDPARLDIRAVFHGEGAEHLLTDEAWDRVRGASGGNPNTALIAELTRNGVHVELCDSRRVSNGWAKSDVHPDVLLVAGAYQRLIDLQLRGYAYIRF
jgi:intracellular sulfur oxidation DsrE/DsrF family protein